MRYPSYPLKSGGSIDPLFFPFIRYVIPSLLASIVLNIPKWFESTLVYRPVAKEVEIDGQVNVTWEEKVCMSAYGKVNVITNPPFQIDIEVTNLRNDPNYIRYYINWTRFLTTGLGPMAALIFFNYSIFRGIRYKEHGMCNPIRIILANTFAKVIISERGLILRLSSPINCPTQK